MMASLTEAGEPSVFTLDGETLDALLDRLAREQLGL